MNQHTIIFVPHARAKFRKWRLSTLQVSLILGSLVVLTLGGLLATFSYYTSAIDSEELKRLREANKSLNEINEGFKGSIRALESQMEDYQQRIHKLAIVAGVSELSPSTEAGIGGTEPASEEGDLNANLHGLEARLQEMGQGMDLLQQKFDEHLLLISAIPAVSPVKGLMTSGFGYRRDPFTGRRAPHRGIDIIAPRGKEVRATGDGLVTTAGRVQGLGNAVYILHGFGLVTRYGHMSKVKVKAGQRVRRGEVIGLVGSTGRSTGNHVHYEVHVDGKATNPLGYILDGTGP